MLDKNNMPQHVAIIMDGNGRWAKKRNLPRTAGHRAGIERIKEIIRSGDELGIKVLTFFTFSAENWNRPKKEVEMLMHSLNNFLERNVTELHKKNIRFRVIGRDNPLPLYIQDKIRQAEAKTKDNTGMTVVLALNYGSRQEIIDAVKKIVCEAVKEKLDIEDLDPQKFSSYLYTADLPDPDLIIRTSAEMRLSNFLLWQASYAEFYFPEKYWPDFRKEDLIDAVKIYQKRERRFGAIKEG